MKILIVDDEKYIRDGIEKRIKRFEKNVEVLKAINGIEALEILSKEIIDVCFIDINMPFLDGLSVIEKSYNKTKFIIISGYDKFEYAKKAIQLNVFSYLLKPIDKQEFNDILEKLINKNTIYTSDDYNFNKIIKDIESNFKSFNYCLSDLSINVNLSESYICRIIKKEANTTFIDLLNKYRINYSKKLILENKENINFKNIYSKIGFSSQQYFNVIFKKYENITPREYLKTIK